MSGAFVVYSPETELATDLPLRDVNNFDNIFELALLWGEGGKECCFMLGRGCCIVIGKGKGGGRTQGWALVLFPKECTILAFLSVL